MELLYVVVFSEWQNIISILLGIASALLTSFLTSYFTEKGKQKAIKENIAEITKIGENIKAELSQNTEVVKAQLSLLNQHKLNLKVSEKQALFDYHNSIINWIAVINHCDLGKFNLENFKEISNEKTKIADNAQQYDVSSSHLELFMHDQKFLDLRRDLASGIIEFQIVLIKGLNNLYSIYSECEILMKDPKLDKRLLALNKANDNSIILTKKINHELLIHFEKIHKLRVPIVILIKKRLTKISEDD